MKTERYETKAGKKSEQNVEVGVTLVNTAIMWVADTCTENGQTTGYIRTSK